MLTGARTLLVAGVGLVVLAVLIPAWLGACAAALGGRRELARSVVTEGEPVLASLELLRRWPVPARVRLRDGLLAGPPVELGPLRARRTRLQGETSFERRGRVRIAPARAELCDPFGLCAIGRTLGPADELLVLPRTYPVRWLGAPPRGVAGSELERLGEAPPAAIDVDGVRPYRPGTPASRIHWPSFARGAGLMERRLHADGDALPLIVLDTARPARREHLDDAVRAAASLTLALARGGGCRLAIGDGRAIAVTPELRAWPGVLEALALVQADPSRNPGELAHGGARSMLLVCAAAPARPGLGAGRVLVLPHALVAPAARPLLQVGACAGYAWLPEQALVA